jgi:hypothetical protein
MIPHRNAVGTRPGTRGDTLTDPRQDPVQHGPGLNTRTLLSEVNGVDEELGFQGHPGSDVDEQEVTQRGVPCEDAVLEVRHAAHIGIAKRPLTLVQHSEFGDVPPRLESHPVVD